LSVFALFVQIVTEPNHEGALRLAVAAVLGGLVGLDRETAGKPAGLRTNMLICVGAALLTQISVSIARTWDPPGPAIADPGRVAAQIVSGIGFLGAGTILRTKGDVRGLTTAASIWVVAAIGMAVGVGGYFLAVATTCIVLLTLIALPWLERRLEPFTTEDRTLRVLLSGGDDRVDRLKSIIEDKGFRARSMDISERGEDELAVTIHATGRTRDWNRLVQTLIGDETVRRVALE
jgi:putative Mg2+ transporter-C (MgtC) family protein